MGNRQTIIQAGIRAGLPGYAQMAQQDIIKQMQTAQEKANLLNEQRYQQILGQFENLGTAGRARIEQQTQQRQAEATQGLMSRGLGNTTITSAVERGISSDAEMQRQQLEESVAMQKAGVMERRTDTGPDMSMFANLMQQTGQQAPAQSATGGIFNPMTGRMVPIVGRTLSPEYRAAMASPGSSALQSRGR